MFFKYFILRIKGYFAVLKVFKDKCKLKYQNKIYTKKYIHIIICNHTTQTHADMILVVLTKFFNVKKR